MMLRYVTWYVAPRRFRPGHITTTQSFVCSTLTAYLCHDVKASLHIQALAAGLHS